METMDNKELIAMREALDVALMASGYAQTSNWAIKHGRSLLDHIAAQDARIAEAERDKIHAEEQFKVDSEIQAGLRARIIAALRAKDEGHE
jgi:hypothetical protein